MPELNARTVLGGLALSTLVAACPLVPCTAGAADATRSADSRSRLDAAAAVKRAGALVEAWNGDRNPLHLDEALSVLQRASDSRYGRPAVLSWTGYVQILRGSYAAAVPPLQEASRSMSASPAADIDLGFALDRLGRYQEGADILTTAATRVPSDSSGRNAVRGRHDLLLRHIFLELGGVYFRGGRLPDAVETYGKAQALDARVASLPADSRSKLDARQLQYLDEDEARIADALGGALRQQGAYARAIEEQRRAVSLRPQNSRYVRDLAETYQSAAVHAPAASTDAAGYWRDAATAYADAIRIDPENADLHDRYGSALSEQGRYADAVREFARADALRPAGSQPSASTLFHDAVSEWHAGNIDRSTALFQQAGTSGPPRAQVLQWQGYVALKSLNPRGAIQSLTEAVRLDPDSFATRLDLGTAYIETGQPDLALPEFQRAVALEPNSLDAKYGLGRALFDLKRYAEAAVVFRKAYALYDAAPNASQVSVFGKGDAMLSRAELQHALGYSLELAGDLAGAAEVHEMPVGSSGPSRDMVQYAAWERYLLASRDPSAENLARAERALEMAVKDHPTGYLLESYGDVLERQHRDADAAPYYGRAIDVKLAEMRGTAVDPETSLYALREKYADVLRRLGRDDEAIRQLELARGFDGKPYNVLVALGALYHKQARQAAERGDTASRDIWYGRAADSYGRALDAMVPDPDKDIPPPPSKLTVRKALAPLQYKLGRFDAADATATAVLGEDPADLNAAMVRYRYLSERRHDGNAARQALESALNNVPSGAPETRSAEYASALRSVAYQYLQHRPPSDSDLHQASVDFNRALQIEPTNAEAYNGKGFIAMKRRDYGAAVNAFKLAIAANPHDATALNNLGEAYEHLPGDHFQEALNSYSRAYAESPSLEAARKNAARYRSYARFGWEPKDHLTGYATIPLYRHGSAPTLHAHRRRRSARPSRRL